VRSSANVEDGTKASFAGLFETLLNINKERLLVSIQKCWASLYNLGAVMYALHQNIPLYSLKMGLLVMEMIDPIKAGVMFTKDITNRDGETCVIEAVFGLGDKVVDGLADPDVIKVSKSDKQIISQSKQILTRTETVKLVTLGIKIEEKYHQPQDIEWAIDKQGKIFILQTRPITV
jgi:pyruvate,water dikinase